MTDVEKPRTTDVVVHITHGPLHLQTPTIVDHVLVVCRAQNNPANSPEPQKLAPDATECEFGRLPPDTYILSARAMTAADESKNIRERALGTPDPALHVTIDADSRVVVKPHRIPRGHIPGNVEAESPVTVLIPTGLAVALKDSEDHRRWFQRHHEAAPQPEPSPQPEPVPQEPPQQ
jgi:hypothetical protein